MFRHFLFNYRRPPLEDWGFARIDDAQCNISIKIVLKSSKSSFLLKFTVRYQCKNNARSPIPKYIKRMTPSNFVTHIHPDGLYATSLSTRIASEYLQHFISFHISYINCQYLSFGIAFLTLTSYLYLVLLKSQVTWQNCDRTETVSTAHLSSVEAEVLGIVWPGPRVQVEDEMVLAVLPQLQLLHSGEYLYSQICIVHL